MRRALNDLKRCVFENLGRQQRGIRNRYDLVIVTVQNQVGTSNLFRSSVRSVSEKALMQKYDAGKPAIMLCSQNDAPTPSEISAPGLL